MISYIVDTNVIIANPYFTNDFENCEINIPIYVLEELDKIKSREGNSGFRARQFFRYFKKIESQGNLIEGIEIKNQVILKGIVVEKLEMPEGFETSYTDNKILALMLDEKYKNSILLTNDISMRVKASSLGLKSKMADTSDKHKLEDLYTGVIEKEVTVDLVKEFHKHGKISLDELGLECMHPNQFFYGYTEFSYSKIAGIYKKESGMVEKLKHENVNAFGVGAKDVRQRFAFEAIFNPDIQMVTMSSRQGCGKTLLAVAAALELVIEQDKYEKILVGKNTSPIDKWSYQGFTTGETSEKLLTHFGNYITTLENIQEIRGKKSRPGIEIIEALKDQNKLDVLDISSILGSSFLNKFVIIDESQSFDVHAMRSIITRIGKGSKIILIGDIAQQTISRLDPDKSGLYASVEWLKELTETAHITLNEVHRSEFVKKASKIFDEKIFG